MMLLKTMLKLAAGTALLGLAACGPDFDRSEVSTIHASYPSGSDSATSRGITVTEGSALILHLVVWNDDDERMKVRFRLSNYDAIEFVPQVDDDNYAVIGKKVGQSQIQILDTDSDDDQVDSITVNVVAQPAVP